MFFLDVKINVTFLFQSGRNNYKIFRTKDLLLKSASVTIGRLNNKMFKPGAHNINT